jgi:hypothetical protein
MEIEGTTFGTITIDGKTYEHDVIIRLSGEVVKRKKKLSKKHYGTSHVLSKDEAKFVFERGCEQLILGSGQVGNVHLSPEAEAYFAKKGCKVLSQPTPEIVRHLMRDDQVMFSIDCDLHIVTDHAGAATAGRHRAAVGISERDLLIG